MFDVRYEPLSVRHPETGSAAIIPWDSETFGFNVALWAPASRPCSPPDAGDLRAALQKWTTTRQVEQVCAKVDPDDRALLMSLQDAGFRYVDTSITAYYKNIETLALPLSPLKMRRADPEDLEAIQSIAAGAFTNGRYHADFRFPNALADKRYDNWIVLACSAENAQEVLAARHEGNICGFSVIDIDPENAKADLGLMALDKRYHGQGLGLALGASTLDYLRQQGVRSVRSCISATNAPIMGLFEKLGARHANPVIVLHWQPPSAPHLNSASKVEKHA